MKKHIAIGVVILGLIMWSIFDQQRTIEKQDELVKTLYKLVNIQEEVINASQEVINLQENIISMN